MRYLTNTLALIAFAAVTNAQIVRVGTYDGDSFIYSVNGSSDTGYVNVRWSGYATPTYGDVGWRIVVWDMASPQVPVANETYHASGREGTYARTFAVTPYHPVRVELYAVGDQYANSSSLSSTVTTSMWVQPIASPVGTSYASPTDWSNPTATVVVPGFPVKVVQPPVTQNWYYYPALAGTIASYRVNGY